MSTVQVKKKNETYLYVDCPEDMGVLYELESFFSFKPPGYQYSPKYKQKIWDGSIKLYTPTKRSLYAGLLPQVKDFCKERGYELEVDTSSFYSGPDFDDNVTYEHVEEWLDTFPLSAKGQPITPHDYQIEAVSHALSKHRSVFVAPTSSGKSLCVYLIAKYLAERDMRTLLIVPSVSLVKQMAADFIDYNSSDPYFDINANTHVIFAGQDKRTNKNIVISTWQSTFKLDRSFFNSFDCMMVDECHLAESKSFVSILEKATEVKYRFGFTGTVDGGKTNALVLTGLLGPLKRVITTKQLMDDNKVAQLNIKSLVLGYSEETRKMMKAATYHEEIDFLVEHTRRSRFIRNLAVSLDGNTLILCNYVKKHAEPLYEIIKEAAHESRPVYFFCGSVDADERERIRQVVETEKNAIIVASYGVASTGISIRSIENIIFASPSKSMVRVLQSIGRGLRLNTNKDGCTLYDIADDMQYKSKKNYSLVHFLERLKIYMSEEFDYKVTKVEIE